FFFSSRRRHTSFSRDWSSDVCSSHLYSQFTPWTDRTDYVASPLNNLGYILAVEKLCGIMAPERAQYWRVIMAELSRIASHLVWLGTHALDIGALSMSLYTFREREMIMDIFETRSEEHTSELQSRENLVCRLLLEKKKTMKRK